MGAAPEATRPSCGRATVPRLSTARTAARSPKAAPAPPTAATWPLPRVSTAATGYPSAVPSPALTERHHSHSKPILAGQPRAIVSSVGCFRHASGADAREGRRLGDHRAPPAAGAHRLPEFGSRLG